jgi:hypothetical protein
LHARGASAETTLRRAYFAVGDQFKKGFAMHEHLAVAVVRIAEPLTAQMPPPAVPGAMSAVKNGT